MNKVYVFLLAQKGRLHVSTLGQRKNQDPYAPDCTIWEGKIANINLGQKKCCHRSVTNLASRIFQGAENVNLESKASLVLSLWKFLSNFLLSLPGHLRAGV